jgi:hypothetical protein
VYAREFGIITVSAGIPLSSELPECEEHSERAQE